MSGGRERDDGGQFKPDCTDEEVLKAVAENEPAGTKEVGNALGIARQSADYRLRQLLNGGEISKKKIGQTLIWSVSRE